MQDQSMVKEIIESFKYDGNKAINFLKSEYTVLKAGRANPHILDKVMVDYYGSMTPITQMGNIAVPEARMLTISVWDVSALPAVRKALQMADLGITPTDDGKVIRLVFPALTEERRKEIVKQVWKIAEDAKISLRNARKDCLNMLKQLKKDSEISEDEMSSLEKEVQKITDQFNGQIETLAQAKEKEVLEI
jgi:ribosome recycling factor